MDDAASQHTDGRAGAVALVTGGAHRLGRACVEALAARGYGVVIHYHRSAEAARSLCATLRAAGARVWTVQADLSDAANAAPLFARAVELAGPVEVLINSASVYEPRAPRECGLDELRRQVELHAFAPFALAQALAAQGRPGLVVNMLDAQLARAGTRYAAYYAGKSLLASLTRTLAVALAPAVRVNAIAPGAVLPPAEQAHDAAYLARVAAANPMGRFGTPDDITRALLYLLDSPFVTGQTLYVDGGYHLRGELHA